MTLPDYQFAAEDPTMGAVKEDFYEGGSATFRMINYNDESSPLYLHLINTHNGYYGHGFEWHTILSQSIQDGYL